MDYRCSRCGRTLSYGETVSFCPFCGQAYHALSLGENASLAALNEGNGRISIGSDSERTIQEKYWKLTQGSLCSAMHLLQCSLPRFSTEREASEAKDVKVPEEYKVARLDIQKFMRLRNSTSFVMFRKNLEEYLADLDTACKQRKSILNIAIENFEAYKKEIIARKLSYELGEWSIEDLEDEYSVQIDTEERFVRDYCTDIAEVLGNMSPDRLNVELDYDPEEIDWQSELEESEQKEFPLLTQGHVELVGLIRKVSVTAIRAVQHNGMFILSAMKQSLDEEFKPEAYIERLRMLAEEDYDPLFGDPPEEFIEVFSRAVANMTAYLNGLLDYDEVGDYAPERLMDQMKHILDQKKLDVLNSLVEEWLNVLSQELDRQYQRQSENMVDIYNSVEQMRKKLADDDEDYIRKI